MKQHFHCLLLLAALLPGNYAIAQADFSKVDAHARSIPFPGKHNVAQLAGNLTAGLKTEKEKARAIFVWIAENIRYDVKTAIDDDAAADAVIERQQATAVLKSKKAICEGYSNLFDALCAAAGLNAVQASGFSKNRQGEVGSSGHAWNLVRTDGVWGLVDVTWGAGWVDEGDWKFHREFNERHFLPQPEDYILDHYPDDPLFQLLPDPIDFQQFKMSAAQRTALQAKEKAAAAPAFPNLKDSLDQFVTLDSNARILTSCLRVLRFDPKNGSANFYMATHHYNNSAALFNQYQTAMNTLAQNRTRATAAMLQNFETTLTSTQTELDKSHRMALRVPSGDKRYKSANALRRNVEEKQKICAASKKRNEEMKAKTKG